MFELHQHKSVFLELNKKPDLNQAEFISELNEIIQKDGCHISFHDGLCGPELCLMINYETAKNSRGAGRNRKTPKGEHCMIRVAEVKAMMENMTAEEVAAELGVSRSTLFRRLKRDDKKFF